ncbi:facilitated trehalose transporter Tret1-like [Neodiprion virginianus]|uniref:facilitated trehalose transporter Tret1-like n=1 Tax=Neodiprion virginianus TaxID=2961670 RepID=UPI001EE6A56A|nr:facilitated trehalose transporter Tret1-like [Neodiprion virginianus]
MLAPQIFAAVTSTVLEAITGFHIGWPSSTLPKLLEDTSVPVTQDQASLIVSLMGLGGMIGPICVALTVDKWGRKTSMILGAIISLIAGIMTTFARSYWWYYVARFASGLGMGFTSVVIPMYLGEIAQDTRRGGLSILMAVLSNSGTVLVYCVGPWISVSILSAFGILMPLVFLLLVPWIPETPYFYTMKGKPELARKSLEFLRSTTDIGEEIEKIEKNVEFDLQHVGTLKTLLTDRGNRKALLLTLVLISAQQLSGITVIASYGTTILNEVDSDISSSTAIIITGVVQLVVSILVTFFADKIGRRPLLLGSMFFSMVFLTALAVYFHLQANGNDVSGISWLPATALVSFLCAFSAGLGGVTRSVISEIFSCNIKAYGTIITVVWTSVLFAVILQLYPTVVNNYGIHIAFYGFTICLAIFSIITFFYLPETNRKSFGEIQLMLHKRSESKQIMQPDPTSECTGSNSVYCIDIKN